MEPCSGGSMGPGGAVVQGCGWVAVQGLLLMAGHQDPDILNSVAGQITYQTTRGLDATVPWATSSPQAACLTPLVYLICLAKCQELLGLYSTRR